MAVTVISQPTPDTDTLISASYPFEIVLQTDRTAANITQHRFTCAVFNDSVEVGIKYTVISQGTNQGKFDLSGLFRSLFTLSQKQYSNENDITQSTLPWRTANEPFLPILVILGEQYYEDGVFHQNAVSTPSWNIVRGYTDDPDRLNYVTNFYQLNGLDNFIPYSGYMPIGYFQRTEDPAWPDPATEPWQRVQVFTYPNLTGSGSLITQVSSRRTDPEAARVQYIPLYWPGETDIQNLARIEVRYQTGPDASNFTTRDSVMVHRNIFACEDEEILVMFQDRFFQWSFMSFPKKHRVTTTTSSQRAELLTGREKYNVEALDTYALNTDWMQEEQNDLMRDLISTEKAYFVDPGDGSLEPVTVVPNSLTYKTSRNNNMIQYSISFATALDNFIP